MMQVDIRILLLIVFALFICFRHNVRELFLPVYSYITGANVRLYDLLSAMKYLFEKYQITYSITGLTLLSAVEKNRLSRGQSVATILLPQSEIDKLLSLTVELKNLGLGLVDLPGGGFRISGALTLPFISDVGIQVYPIAPAGDKWITTSKLLGYDEWYDATDLFPTKMYQLGNLDLAGPQNPIPYLQRNFWSLGIGHSELIGVPRKKWYNISPRRYIQNLPPQIDQVNGIMLDPRPIPGKQTIVMGNNRLLVVPTVGQAPLPRKSRWRRYLWE